ncbi:YidC/Oxa1 family membrane protein insertase [Fodinisporobacter ferrooxydans]|uniref:YidC/Oxa1 family membrane protein insertase n=1 Tax=Fodinisporobacter ferrooxydans TaxID=2901836 RepID=A0ABY4CMM6_9BACL|nr:YidC/Oxa1 family membrane protein insertase [Alicyclobacillaceae bacterium MYW30-H2]
MSWWSNFVSFISDGIDFFAHYTGYGWSILIVTLIIRLATLPFYLKQLRYTKGMQVLQPEIKKIRDKHKNDAQKMQQEMMKLYQQYNLNPLSGCFPILIQMPILLALYRAIMYNTSIKSASFLWVSSLGLPDHFYILPILAAALTYFQQKMMMVGTIGGMSEQQQKMMLIIYPVMILFISFKFPAALALYWVYGSVFTIAQTYFTKTLPAKKEEATAK